MKKPLLITTVVFLALLLSLYFTRNIIAKSAFQKAVEIITGLKLSVSDINVRVFRSTVDVKGLKLYNPQGYSDKLMLDLPVVFLDYNLGAFFRNRIHLKSIKIYLKEVVVVNNADGKMNTQVFEKFMPKKEGKAPEFKIDHLALKIDKVIYKDYFKKKTPSVLEFNVNIDEEYRDIDNPQALVSLIAYKALMNTAIGSLVDIDQFKIDSSGILKEANRTLDSALDKAKGLGKTGQDALGTFKDVGHELKNIFSKDKN